MGPMRSNLMNPNLSAGGRVLAGKGSGRLCSRCNERIEPGEIEYEVELTAREVPAAAPVALIFHIRCYDAWRKTLSPACS
jgi:hypothetical protein